jgi:hypothetical protein
MSLEKQLADIRTAAEDLQFAISEKIAGLQRKRIIFAFSSIILSSVVTIVLGIKEIPYGTNIALVLSGLLTMVTGFDTFFEPRKIANAYKKHSLVFMTLFVEIDFYKNKGELKQEDIDVFRERFLIAVKDLGKEVEDLGSGTVDSHKTTP